MTKIAKSQFKPSIPGHIWKEAHGHDALHQVLAYLLLPLLPLLSLLGGEGDELGLLLQHLHRGVETVVGLPQGGGRHALGEAHADQSLVVTDIDPVTVGASAQLVTKLGPFSLLLLLPLK